MSTAAQIAANRANAQHSTGPRTEEGKAASSRNACRHGLFTAIASLSPAERDRFDSFHTHYAEMYQPDGAEQSRWVAELALADFRRDRVRMMEAGFFAERMAQIRKKENLPEKMATEQEWRLYARVLIEDAEGGRSVLNRLHKWERAFTRDIEKLTGLLIEVYRLRKMLRAKTNPISSQAQPIEQVAESMPPVPEPAPAARPVARGARCPCGSGQKYKRCCGRSAPGIIHPVNGSPGA